MDTAVGLLIGRVVGTKVTENQLGPQGHHLGRKG